MLDEKNLAILEAFKSGRTVVEDVEEMRCITWANMSGDISLSWSADNDDRVKAIIKAKMAQGYSFFTMRKVVIDAVKVKRKIGAKGVDTIDNLVIDDDTFEKMVKGLDDRDLADALNVGTAKLAKRRGSTKAMDAIKKLKSPDEVIKARQSLAIRPLVGG